MSTICLADYLDSAARYVFDATTGRLVPCATSSADDVDGFARHVKLGLLRRRRVCAAVYADKAVLWFQVGAERYSLTDPDVRLRRRIPAPFVRKISVSRGGTEVFSCCYWVPFRDSMTFPDYDDFFHYVQSVAGNPPSAQRVMEYWVRDSRHR